MSAYDDFVRLRQAVQGLLSVVRAFPGYLQVQGDIDLVAGKSYRVNGSPVARFIGPNDAEWVGTAGAPLTSTDWDGDAHSTTAKTLIDLSAVFGVPTGVKAVELSVAVRDSASASGYYFFLLGPTNTANAGRSFNPSPVDDRYQWSHAIIPCDANGDMYYQISASGAGTLDVILEIWGYWKG